MVGKAGLEPAMPVAADLQSAEVTNFSTFPYSGQLSLSPAAHLLPLAIGRPFALCL